MTGDLLEGVDLEMLGDDLSIHHEHRQALLSAIRRLFPKQPLPHPILGSEQGASVTGS